MDITNKIVFITGASSGIGAATARAFAQLGCQLILTARRIERLEDLADEISNNYAVEVLPLALDVTNKNLIAKTFDDLPNKWRNISILINNAGLALGLTSFQTGDVADWDTVIDTNVKGVLYITRAIINTMLKQKEGHIINIGSVAGHETYPNGAVYCASKAAVKAISQGLKLDLLGTPIRVSSVDPGLVDTEFSEVRFKGDLALAQKTYDNLETLHADDVAEFVTFCATRPAHVNINQIIAMPTAQASTTHVHRGDWHD